jgi:hypothetical protein
VLPLLPWFYTLPMACAEGILKASSSFYKIIFAWKPVVVYVLWLSPDRENKSILRWLNVLLIHKRVGIQMGGKVFRTVNFPGYHFQ